METYKHLVEIVDRYITIKGGRRFVAGNANVDTLIASFDAAWKGCEVSVIFAPQNGEPVRQRYGVGMTVPPEVLAQDGFLYVTFVGTRDGNVVIETAMQSKPFVIDKEGVVNGADPIPPTPSEYQQLMAEISRIRQDIEAGLLKGDKGDNGDDADIAGAEAAKDAANEAATRANAEADRAHAATLEAAAATQGADRAAREAAQWADYAQDSANGANAAATNANEAASNATRTAAKIRQRADSGEFDGKDGKTPVKGVDYFDGEAGHSPVITASKADGVTTIYSDGVVIASVDDGVTPEITAAIISNALGFVPQKDTRINGASIVVEGVADIPRAIDGGGYGVVKYNSPYGVAPLTNGNLQVRKSNDAEIDARAQQFKPIVPNNLDYAVKAAMCDTKGQSWTENEQLNARKRIGFGGDFEFIEEIVVNENTNRINREYAPDGRAYNLIALYIETEQEAVDTSRNGYVAINGRDALFIPTVISSNTKRASRTFAIPVNGILFGISMANANNLGESSGSTTMGMPFMNPVAPPINKIGLRLASNVNFPIGMRIRIYGAWA